jgi:RIO kinase 1
MSRLDRYTDYEDYENQFDPMQNDRQARRKRKPKTHHKPKKTQSDLMMEVADSDNALEQGWKTTYQPSRFEDTWLLQSLEGFFLQEQITDILAVVKGGKEASVYTCEAHPNTGFELLAAKVYRPHIHRQFRNDAAYREGRDVLTEDGHSIKKTDHRIMRALGKKSAFGREVSHTSWLMYEFTTLQKLYQLGASVPMPVSAGQNAILMEYIGEEGFPAPLLSAVTLEPGEAPRLFDGLMRDIELMLRHGWVHGDLSAYNVLYWQGAAVLIDFPQVLNVESNSQGRAILERDLERLCSYFASQGLERDSRRIARELWQRYQAVDPMLQAADQSRWEVEEA